MGTYDLYVYTVTNSSTTSAELNLSTGQTSGPSAYYVDEQNGANFNGTSFIQGEATTQAAATTANYVEFALVAPVGGVLTVSLIAKSPDTVDGIGVNAFELVEVPEPSSEAMLVAGIGSLLFLVRRQLRREA
jgi:hypothetical protein